MNKDLFQDFKKLSFDEEMKNHTSFQLGGPVDVFIEGEGIEDIRKAVEICKKENIPLMVLGKGTNLLISDKGMDGLVLHIGEAFTDIHREGQDLVAGAGLSLKKLAEFALKEGLTGLEFAHGIPGSVGGAMTMNAGAYDGECVQVVKEVGLMTRDGDYQVVAGEDMDFAYRHSRIQDEGSICLWARFALKEGDLKAIKEKMEDLWQRRVQKQPLEYASAGSMFKRPPGHYAGQLIDQAGCRGLYHKGAQISQKHCGFVINRGGARTQDVVDLIHTVQKEVKDRFRVDLETEVRVLGR